MNQLKRFETGSSNQKLDLYSFIQKHTISNHVIDRRTATNLRKFDAPGYNGFEKRKESERRKTKLGKNK